MTTAAAAFTSARGRTLSDEFKLPFQMDGDSFVLLQPKTSVSLAMLALVDDATDDRPLSEQGSEVQRLLYTLLAYVEPQPNDPDSGELRGQALLRYRLDDPEDGFDLPDLEPVLRLLIKEKFGRPTKAQPA